MAVYSEQYKFIFFANPQTASKAIAMTLRHRLGATSMPERELTRNGKVIAKAHHTTYSEIRAAGLLSEAQLEALFKVTSIRNPFDQLVSKYLKYCDRNGNDPTKYPWLKELEGSPPENSFPQWLDWLCVHYTEVDKITKGPLEFLDHADHVIRFENLQAGFDEFMLRIGIKEPVPITTFNVTKARAATDADPEKPVAKKKKNYTEYYDTACVEIVENLYGPILKRFGYKFGD